MTLKNRLFGCGCGSKKPKPATPTTPPTPPAPSK